MKETSDPKNVGFVTTSPHNQSCALFRNLPDDVYLIYVPVRSTDGTGKRPAHKER